VTPAATPIMHPASPRFLFLLGLTRHGDSSGSQYAVIMTCVQADQRIANHRHYSRMDLLLKRLAPSLIWLAALLFPTATAHALHPSLIFKPDDVPRVRHWCGIQRDEREPDETYGVARLDYRAVREYFRMELGETALPGEILAAAFLHLVEPEDPDDARRMGWIERRLTHPDWTTLNPVEYALALDWCAGDISSVARRSLLLAAQDHEQPFSAEITPFTQRTFDAALFGLALAVAVGPEDESSRAWVSRRGRLIEAGTEYARKSLPHYLDCRTPAPTSPALAAEEETCTALLIEVLSAATGRDLWSRHGTTLRRWMEHYIIARPPGADPPLLFIRDDGNGGIIHPAGNLSSLHPLVAHLFACRTRAAAANTVADRVATQLRHPPDAQHAGSWRWVPAALRSDYSEVVDEARLPVARNLGAGIVLRGQPSGAETRIWIDAGQPRYRPGQHFDAGHFLIHRGGYQTVMAADDVSSLVRPGIGGKARLGTAVTEFDFEQFQMAGISHNCMVFEDPAYRPTSFGRIFLPGNGQDLQVQSSEPTEREQGVLPPPARIAGYSTQPGAAYVALDLTGAFDRHLVRTYSREFFWLDERFLVIVDRWRCPHSRVTPTVMLQLPVQPTIGGVKLPEPTHGPGGDPPAGIWQLETDAMLTWSSRSGAVAMRHFFPQAKELRIVGGPAERLNTDPDGRSGLSYVGGSADSFERLILPADRSKRFNAWFRIGKATRLDPAIGVLPRWGRIELETFRSDEPQRLITALVIHDAGGTELPVFAAEENEGRTQIAIEYANRRVSLALPPGLRRGGEVQVPASNLSWIVPQQVLLDPALPTRTR
jgi:hypothetical protein